MAVALMNGPDENQPQSVTVRPLSGLKSGANYTLELWNLSGVAGSYGGAPIRASFMTYGGDRLGSKGYTDDVYDVARLGALRGAGGTGL